MNILGSRKLKEFFNNRLIIKTQKFKRKARRIEMKKLSVFYLVAFVFVFFSFSFASFAQDKSKKPDNSKAELQERVNALSTEEKAINALKDKITKRKAAYDNKCTGKTFNPDAEQDKQIIKECQEESEWLISSQKSLKERQQKYDKNFAQLKLDVDAFQKATNAAKLQERERVNALNEAKKSTSTSKSLQERSDALNQESKNINALKTDYKKRLEEFSNVKCSEKALNLLMGEKAEQKVNECNKERNEIIGIQEEIAKRETKYNAEYKQFISDFNAAKGKKN
jgi:hypothetical protein